MNYHRPVLLGFVLCGVVWLSACNHADSGLSATLTLKDGTHFSGTVIRRESGSITLKNGAHETRTFLNSELADIKYSTPESTTSSRHRQHPQQQPFLRQSTPVP